MLEHKRKLSFHWRLFLPFVLTLWVLLLGLAFWQSYRERQYRTAFVSQQLKLVNSRVMRAVCNNDWRSIEIYKAYLKEFYVADPLFDDVRMTIYDDRWNLVDTLGETAIKLAPIEMSQLQELVLEDSDRAVNNGIVFRRQSMNEKMGASKNFYMGNKVGSEYGNYYIISALPDDEDIESYITGTSSERLNIWIGIFVIALALTLLGFIMTKRISRNIDVLRDFASRTANDPWFVPNNDFAHDELGDIAHQIVQMYNERAKALERMEAEHQMAIHAIEERGRQKRQLTNDINHEFKTPIGVIKGYLDTIVDTPDMDDNTKQHFLKKARDHVDRLVDLMSDISAITRLEEGEGQINTEELDFHELAYVFGDDARESGILGHYSIGLNVPHNIQVKGNNSLLIGMLMNLTKNAVNYAGGDKINIEYRGEDGDFYKFAFFDNGRGVPESAIDHLFDRFYRIDSGRARKSGGTGLGLAIVFNTIKAHSGKINVRNRPEGGLEFEFTLPKWRA